jgi:hypothetical protein
VYYSGDAVGVASRLISCWGHAVEWILHSKDMEDMERAERFKVRHVQMQLKPAGLCADAILRAPICW